MHENSTKAEKKLDLGNGLSIWLVHIDALREQDLNARVMDDATFRALVENIKADQRLESLPLTTLKTNQAGNEEFHVISEHHKTRAARAAQLTELYVMVFNEAPDDNFVKAKQLAHNAIQGQDDPQKLKEIFDSIDDLRARIAAAIRPEDLRFEADRVKSEDLAIRLDFELLNLLFLRPQKESFEDMLKLLIADTGENVLVAEFPAFEKFKKAALKVSRSENIRNVTAIVYRMSQIVRDYYAKIEAEGGDDGGTGNDKANA